MSATFGIEVMLLLTAAMVGVVLAKRIGQSAIVGMILIGVLLGPTLLDLVSYSEPIKILAEVGLIIMLFTIGLESDYKEIYRPKNVLIAIFGMIIPFLAGWGLAALFGYSTVESIFIGTALTATSIAITAHILQERKLLASPVAKTIIGAAVVDDILSLLILSVVSTVGTAQITVGFVLWKVAIAFAFVAASILLIEPVRKLLRKVQHKFHEGGEELTIFAAMAFVFGYAGLASIAGLSSIVGAFLAGVTLSAPLQDPRFKQVHESTTHLQTLFSAIFFVSLGIVADFSTFGGAWLFAIVLTIVAVLTKFIGCMIPAFLAGHSVRGSAAIGLGMVPRGEVAMIVGLLGLSAGIITESVYGVIIVMAFVTTVLTPVLLRSSLRSTGAQKN